MNIYWIYTLKNTQQYKILFDRSIIVIPNRENRLLPNIFIPSAGIYLTEVKMLYEKLILKFLKEKCEGCHSVFYLEKEKREKVITIGYGLSKSKKVSASNFLCANSEDIFGRIKDTLKSDPNNLIVHAGTKNIDGCS